MYEALEKKWQAFAARVVWLREEAGDVELLAFFAERGFAETFRGRHEHLTIVTMEKAILDET